MTPKDFISYVRQECKKADIRLVLQKKPSIKTPSGIKVSGYFSDDERVLAVATGKPLSEWLPILAHEFGHLRQMIEGYGSPDVDGTDYGVIFDLWLNHKIELTPKQLQKYTLPTILMEQDCEQRVIKFIDKYNLPIDKEHYMKLANAYVLSHFVIMQTRLWPKRPAYKNKDIIAAMPAHFNLNYKNPPKKLVAVIKRHLK